MNRRHKCTSAGLRGKGSMRDGGSNYGIGAGRRNVDCCCLRVPGGGQCSVGSSTYTTAEGCLSFDDFGIAEKRTDWSCRTGMNVISCSTLCQKAMKLHRWKHHSVYDLFFLDFWWLRLIRRRDELHGFHMFVEANSSVLSPSHHPR